MPIWIRHHITHHIPQEIYIYIYRYMSLLKSSHTLIYAEKDAWETPFCHCQKIRAHFSFRSSQVTWEQCQLMRESVTQVTACLIGLGISHMAWYNKQKRTQNQTEYSNSVKFRTIFACSQNMFSYFIRIILYPVLLSCYHTKTDCQHCSYVD